MSIFRIEVPAYELRGLPEDKWNRLTEILPLPPYEKRSDWYESEFIVDLSVVMPVLQELGIEPKLKAFKNTLVIGVKERIDYLELQQKLLREQIYRDGFPVQVHVPNVGLYLVNEVQVLENACTDALQGELNDGWRILCVCPPNGQRRPDYILGRTKPAEVRQ